MNAMLFGEKDDTPGGRAIKFYSSIRIKVARRAWIEVPNKNPMISSANVKVGMIMKCKVVKSKVCNPFGEAEIPLFFDRGFTSFADLKSVRREIMLKNSKGAKKADGDEEDQEV
jgi:recombination protein RecA